MHVPARLQNSHRQRAIRELPSHAHSGHAGSRQLSLGTILAVPFDEGGNPGVDRRIGGVVDQCTQQAVFGERAPDVAGPHRHQVQRRAQPGAAFDGADEIQ